MAENAVVAGGAARSVGDGGDPLWEVRPTLNFSLIIRWRVDAVRRPITRHFDARGTLPPWHSHEQTISEGRYCVANVRC